MSNYGYPALDDVAKREQSRLDGPFHGADDDEAHVQIFGYPRRQLLFQLCALFAAKFRQLGVVEAIVLYVMLVGEP